MRNDGTVAGRGSFYLMNTTWITNWFALQIRADIGFVPQPFPFALGVGIAFGRRAGVSDICPSCT